MTARRLLGCALFCLLAACAKPPADEPASAPPSAPPTEPSTEPAGKLTIAVVPKATAHQFWKTVEAGARAAGTEGGAEIIWKGPDKETDVTGQTAMIEDFVTQKVDAIVMAACDAEALSTVVQDAEEAGVPVITIDSGITWDGVRSLVSTDNVEGAYQAGLKLFELIGGQGPVGLIPFIKGAASSDAREEGFKKAVGENPDIELAATLYSDSDISKGKDVTIDMLTSHPDLRGIFAANEAGALGAASAIEEQKLQGKVVLVAFDGSPDQQKLLRDGVIQALVVQNPFKMGFEGVRLAIAATKGETVEKRVDTGVTVVTLENLDDPDIQELLNPTTDPS